MANRLAKETSPYLLQHKNNPVDWYPWSDEALSRARAENKPILLSVGYSACHWCHVMEHESFENVETARLMNENFVCIKVDREERPDLDQIYQNVAQAMTRGGGWPLTVFLTPELEPFYGGTYFPPDDRYGRPGFPRLLEALARAYREDLGSVTENAKKLMEVIASLESVAAVPWGNDSLPTRDRLLDAASSLMGSVDLREGGFAGAPKFPNPMAFAFLWRMQLASPDGGQVNEAVLTTLVKMAQGGIFDQLGGGFHRYSVDETWSVPHFEKMLYDNGLLLKLYSEVLLAPRASGSALEPEREELFLDVLVATVDYLATELRAPEGGFYAAQDADSEGEEGKFFVWDRAEIRSYLDESEASLFCDRYGVTDSGNFEHGKTVLYQALSAADAAKKAGVSETDARKSLASSRAKLLEGRGERVPPATDTKILTSWNGLAISGLAWAARALSAGRRDPAAEKARTLAVQAFDFVSKTASRPDGRLYATIQEGKPKLEAYLDDYAFMAMGALDLARFSSPTDAERLIAQAGEWISTVLRDFRGGEGKHGYFFTSDHHEKLIHRPKTVFDQAIPSGTSVTLLALGALSEMDFAGRSAEFESELEAQLRGLFHLGERSPHGTAELLSSALQWLIGPAILSGEEARQCLASPWVYQKGPTPGASELLVCRRHSCEKYLTPERLMQDLRLSRD